ncbi:hypothetical protein MKEN_00850600 [Mycena kentingensis (nom. inval.)]|nr:hypothetical protein MKEN_00850600 [Mycena kentingensis (nom. inval.)]
MPSPPALLPSIPTEILLMILSAAWHAPLSPKERDTLLHSCALVNSAWANLFNEEVAGRDVYIHTPEFAEWFSRHLVVPPKPRRAEITRHSSGTTPTPTPRRIPRIGQLANLFHFRSAVAGCGASDDSTSASQPPREVEPGCAKLTPIAGDPRRRRGPTDINTYNRRCRSITVEIRRSAIQPTRSVAQDGFLVPVQERFPMGSVLDALLEYVDAHFVLPNLRRLCVEYVECKACKGPEMFDDIFRRGLFALPPQINHLELRYPSSSVTVQLQEAYKSHRQTEFRWVAPEIERVSLMGAPRGVLQDLGRVCKHARLWEVDGVCVRLD